MWLCRFDSVWMASQIDDVKGKIKMKQRCANILLRLAFRIFRRYHKMLSKEIKEIIWGEISRNPDYVPGLCEPNCSMCVREAEEDRERQRLFQRWLKGELA